MSHGCRLILATLMFFAAAIASASTREEVQATVAKNNRIVAEKAARTIASVSGLKTTGRRNAECAPKVSVAKGEDVAPVSKADAKLVEPEDKMAKLQTHNGEQIDVSVIPKAKLQKVFDELMGGRQTNNLSWRNTCLCYARAHIGGWALKREMKLETAKIMSWPKREFMGLAQGSIRPKFKTGRIPDWSYHVANMVLVEETPGAKPVQYVLDPALFPEGAVPRKTWEEKQEGLGKTYVTNRYALDPNEVEYTGVTDYPSDPNDRHSVSYQSVQQVNKKYNSDCKR